MTDHHQKYILTALQAAIQAGERILEVYQQFQPGEEILKSDSSPLTKADLAAHQVILETLAPLQLPVMSEEGDDIHFEERSNWEKYWCVDPLDGTKEFVNKNDEFTVNIALIENGAPTLGIVYVPVSKKLYWGIFGEGSFTIENPGTFSSYQELIDASFQLPSTSNTDKYTIVQSRSHLDTTTKAFIQNKTSEVGNVDRISRGSSLKFCMLAEGKADCYPRFGPTMEWDTAAAHAILKANNIEIRQMNGQPLEYNKKELVNPHFIAEWNSN